MATTYGMGGGTPIMSTTMPPPPSGMGGMTTPMATPMATPMTTPMATQNMSGMNIGGFTRNMNLPLSTNRPIDVDERTPNLEEIQGFPVAGRTLDGTHFHQDPVSGQMYRMTDELHARIPQILANRISSLNLKITIPTDVGDIEYSVNEIYRLFMEQSGNTEILKQFKDTSYENDLQKIRESLGKSIIESALINDYNYYTDNVDTKKNNIIINKDGSYEILGIDTSYFNEQKTPINKILNATPSAIQELSLRKYNPVNRFTSLFQNLTSTIMMGNKYTPINKFYNR